MTRCRGLARLGQGPRTIKGEELRRCLTVGWSTEVTSRKGRLGEEVRGPALWRAAFALSLLLLLVFSPVAEGAPKTVANTLGNAAGVGSVQGSGTTGGLFNTPRGVAVNYTGAGGVDAGTFYVVDTGNRRVQRFSPTAEFVSAWGWGVRNGENEFQICTVASSCERGLAGNGAGEFGNNGAQGIAVDQSTGAVYVSDQATGNRRVNIFSAKGVIEGAFGWGVRTGANAFEFCTAVSGCRAPNTTAGSQGGKLGTAIGGVAVDASGDVYVADRTNRRVSVFRPTVIGGAVVGIEFLRAFGWGVSTGVSAFEVCTVASDCKSGSTAAPGDEPGQFGANSPSDVAVDSAGNVYALDLANARVQKFDSTPAPTEAAFGSAALSAVFEGGSLQSIALDPEDHLYVSGQRAASSNRVAVVELDSSGASVEVHGSDLTVNLANGLAAAPVSLGGNIYLSSSPEGHRVFILNEAPTIDPVTIFDGTTATFSGEVVSNEIEVTYHFEYSTDGVDWTSFPVPDAEPGSVPGTIPVSQEATGLTGSQEYRVRLVQNRPAGGGRAISLETTFTTDPAAPAITGTEATQITDTAATLRSTLDAQNQGTTYYFEYTDDADFQANGFDNAIKTAAGDAGSGGGPLPIARDVAGLVPGTLYHFRLVAENATSETVGPEATFTTYPAGSAGQNCPNAAFRGGASGRLPACRAYELVSPADANGLLLGFVATESGSFTTSLAAPGSALFTAASPLPGSEGSGKASLYRSVRGTDGWSVESLNPTGGQGVATENGGVSPDHLYATWKVELGGSLSFPEGPAFYVRRPGGAFDLMGQGSLGVDPCGEPQWISPGGAHMIFSTGTMSGCGNSVQLEPAAPPEGTDAIYDRTPDGETHVVSLLPGELTPAGDAVYQGASADGSSVAFTVEETLYVRQDNAETIEIAPSPNTFAGFSSDGERVFFIDTTVSPPPFAVDPPAGLFAFDLDTRTKTEIAANSRFVNVAADGTRAYFTSTDVLDDANEGELGIDNLYLWDGTTIRFVAQLDPEDLNGFYGGTEFSLVRWTEAVGPQQTVLVGPVRNPSRTTPDGSVLVFESHAALTGHETSGHSQVYRYDADADGMDCVSCNPTGVPSTSDSPLQISALTSFNAPTRAMNPVRNVTDDGRSVFFQSDDPLAPSDVNGTSDVYEWRDGVVALISSGQSASPSYLTGVTADGRDVFFKTQEALLPEDKNSGSGAIYDARAGGGFASAATGSTTCTVGEDCQAAAVPPAPPSMGSATFTGPGDVVRPRKKCGKHKQRRRGRCVRKKKQAKRAARKTRQTARRAK